MSGERILLVQDDPDVRTNNVSVLNSEGWTVVIVKNQSEAISLVRGRPPDLAIIDLTSSARANLEACHLIRSDCLIPIIVITSLYDEACRVAILEAGADACMHKDVSARELVARIRSLLRRNVVSSGKGSHILDINGFSVNSLRRTVTVRGRVVHLTPREFDLLSCFALNKNVPVTRQELFALVWGKDSGSNERTVDVHIRWLRQKLEPDPDCPKQIITVRKQGYMLVTE